MNRVRLGEYIELVLWKIFILIFRLCRQICEVLHSIRGNQESLDELCETIYLNTERLFFSTLSC